MEKYHERYKNTDDHDIRLQDDMFCHLNAPPILLARPYVRKVRIYTFKYVVLLNYNSFLFAALRVQTHSVQPDFLQTFALFEPDFGKSSRHWISGRTLQPDIVFNQ